MSNISSINNSVLSDLSIDNKKEEKKSNELGQSAFLELMITQMNNQNPLDPQENSEFVAQLAQFSTVEGIEKMNSSLDSMSSSFQSSQALQASALVGRDVLVENDIGKLDQAGGTVRAIAELPDSTSDFTFNVYNATGQLVRTYSMGPQASGSVEAPWDGKDESGNILPAGTYRFEALAYYDGDQITLKTYTDTNVDSVTLGQGGNMTLNLNGVGPVPVTSIKEIL